MVLKNFFRVTTVFVFFSFPVFSSVASQWDKPSGKRYSVSSSSEIKNLQKSLKPGDYMVMRGGVWKDAKFTLTANGTSGVGKAVSETKKNVSNKV